MKRIAAFFACALMAVSGCSSSGAKAAPLTPDQKFVHDVRSSTGGVDFVHASDKDLTQFGHGICSLLDSGLSPAGVSAAILGGRTQLEIFSADAAVSISTAVKLLCPKYQSAIQAWDGAPGPYTPATTTTVAPPTRTSAPARTTTTIK
jgi:hypothetical protein